MRSKPVTQRVLSGVAPPISRGDFVLPERLEHALEEALRADLETTLSACSISDVEKRVRSGESLDYDSDAAPFAYLYFAANYIKGYLVAESCLDLADHPLRILDVGCGSGASTAGVVSALAAKGHSIEQVVGVDHSSTQLEWFEHVFATWMNCECPTTEVVLDQDDARNAIEEVVHEVGSYDLLILSYILCELPPNEQKAILELLDLAETEFLAIDNSQDGHPIFRTRRSDWKPLDLRGVHASLRFPPRLGLAPSPKYSSPHALSPRTESRVSALDRYMQLWREHDVDGLKSFFAPDAEYRIIGKRTFVGLPQIEAYWRENSREQCNVKCAIIVRDEWDSGAVAQWSATFLRVDKQARYYLAGMLWLSKNAGLVTRLVECFEKKIVGADDEATWDT